MQLQNHADAEDCFQNAFVKLLTKNPSLNDENHLKNWLLPPTEYPVLGEDERMLSDEWHISNVESGPVADSARINAPVLNLNELYKGSITVITAKNSPYAADNVLWCDVTADFPSLNDHTYGTVALKLGDNDNGEKSVSFCPYQSDAYLPSGYVYNFTFTGKTADGKEVTKTVTQTLSENNNVTITI